MATKKTSATKVTKSKATPAKSKVTPTKNSEDSKVVTPVAEDAAFLEMKAVSAELFQDPTWAPFVESQKKNLLDLKDNILDNVSSTTRDTLRTHAEGSEASGSGEHTGDAGSDAYDREFALSLLTQGQASLTEIEDALDKIERGIYGVCDICHKPIPRARLEAIPFACLTVDCKSAWEKEHGSKTRFRPKRYGFGYADNENEAENSQIPLDEEEE